MRINWSGGYKDIDVKDESYRFREIMGENSLTLYFALPNFIEFPLGAYVNFQTQRYTLNSPQILKKINDTHFEYTLILESEQALLHNYKIKDVSGRLKFPITAKPSQHLDLLIRNLNQNDSGWSVGSCITSAEKLISYNHNTCRESLQLIAEAFNTEWEVVGKAIHLRKVEYNKSTPLPLSYGKGNGFRSGVGRTNDDSKKGFNVLYVQGGERNVDYSKYGNKDLLLPKNQQYIHEGVTYVSDAKGLSIQKNGVVITNRREASLDLTNIYPKREGAISTVTVKDAEKNFYDFTDTNIPDALDYSKHLIANDEDLVIQFESGMLSGREFSAKYIHESKRFEIKPSEQDGYTMPNDTFKPAVGDKYAVFNMMMPNEYICDNTSKTGASWGMMKEACKYFYENTDSKFSFTGEVDGIWAKKDWVNIGGKIKTGGYISFSDNKFQPSGILIRIQSVKDYINNPHNPKVELSNSVQGKSIYSEIFKAKENEVLAEALIRQVQQYAKRGFSNSKEALKLIQKTFTDFNKSIRPATVETMAALLGHKSLQFRFVNSKANPTAISLAINFNKTKKKLEIPQGILQHQTIGIDGVKVNRPASEYKYWDFPAYSSAVLDSKDKQYNLYVKCSRTAQTAEFVLSEVSIEMEAQAGYYHFLAGYLHAEINGVRAFSPVYGFTEILPGQMTLRKIQSEDAGLVVDFVGRKIQALKGAEIVGNIKFISGNSNIDLATWAGNTEVSVQKADGKAQNALVKAAQIEADNEAKLKKLQEQIDNEISSYAYPYKPTPSNYPASEWTTEELKLRHDKDVFFNNKSFVDNTTTPDAGKAWRWMKMNGAWKWNQIADSDTVKALKEASKAQAMADGKSTLFGFTPNVVRADGFCYRQGDSWILNANKIINGTTYKRGEILTATQDSTAFNEAHWLKQVRYTDDTAVENLEIWHENLVEGGREERSGGNSEFLRTIDLAPIFDKYGLREYTLSFELKTKSATNKSEMYVYMQNGSGTKYSFVEKWVSVSEQYKLFTITATPVPKNTELPEAYLSFYGGYNTSNIPIVRKIKLQIGSKYTGDSISNADREAQIEKARQEATEAKQIGINAHSTAKAAQQSNKNLENYVDGAFEDNILTVAEKKSIEKYKNTLNEAMSKAEASYLKVYTNTYLLGTAKTNLSNAKISLWGQRDTLVNAINTALSSSTTVANIAARKTAIDSAFTSFNSKMKAFQEAIEEANKAIQEKLKAEAEANTRDAVKEVVTIKDTRSVNELPKFYYENYPRRTVREFKTLSIVALNKKATGHYCELETTVRWADASGGAVVQKATTDSNKVFTRASSSSTVWGEWKEIEDTESAKIKIELAKKEALKATGEVDKEFKEFKVASQKFKSEVEGAFRDGVISEAEARSIEKYKNTIEAEKANVDAQYNKIYADADLAGVAKTNLAAKKTALNTAYSNLVSAIDTAIKDWKTTPAEKTNVDTKFSTYSTALGNLRKAFEEAIKAIEDKKIADAEAKIESLKNDLTPTKQQADYLSKALKQDSEVQGGLVLSSVVAARDSEGAVKSYMSGDPALNNVGFATGVKNFGTQGESQNVALRHDGTAKVGIFVIDAEGNIRVFDINNKERIGFYEHDIDTLQDIIAESTFSLEESGGAGVTHSFTSENFIVDGLSIVVPKNSGTLKLSASLVVDIKPECVFVGHEEDCSFSAVYNVNIILCKDGVEYLDLKNYQENIDTSDGGRITKNFEFNTSTVVPTGTYTVKVKKSVFVEVGKCSAFLSFVPKFTWNLDAGNFKKTVFGKNGFLSAFPHQLFYFTQEKGLVVNSQTDMPGLLATGSVTANGNVSNLWGAKVNNVNTPSKVSQGRYRVPHNIGHSNYTISVMCHSVGVVATVGTKASSYFEFYMQKNGNYYDSGFDYVVYGRNY